MRYVAKWLWNIYKFHIEKCDVHNILSPMFISNRWNANKMPCEMQLQLIHLNLWTFQKITTISATYYRTAEYLQDNLNNIYVHFLFGHLVRRGLKICTRVRNQIAMMTETKCHWTPNQFLIDFNILLITNIPKDK